MYCSNCGKELADVAVICPACGVPTDNYKAQTQAPQYQQPIVINNTNTNTNVNNVNVRGGYPHKSKSTALLLAIFGGWCGLHRFYVGKVGTGLIWLFTFGFGFFGWGIDVLTILFGSFRDKNGYPLV